MTEDKIKAPAEVADYSAGQAKIGELIAFHGHPVGAQLLREVLGWLGEQATAAIRKRPRNRELPELAGWNPPHLRLLAELCRAYAPEVGTINAPRDPDLFPDATSPNGADPVTEIARIEQEVIAERAGTDAVAVLTEVLGAEELDPAMGREHPELTVIHAPDPYVEPPLFYVPDPAPSEPAPANADESRAAQGGDPPF